MNETGRHVPGARSRIWGTAVAALLLLCLAAPVLAGPPQAVLDKKALKQAEKVQRQVQKQAAKTQHQAAKQAAKAQKQAAKAQHQAAKAQKQAAKAQRRAAKHGASAQAAPRVAAAPLRRPAAS